jgi:hypothetical protein
MTLKFRQRQIWFSAPRIHVNAVWAELLDHRVIR